MKLNGDQGVTLESPFNSDRVKTLPQQKLREHVPSQRRRRLITISTLFSNHRKRHRFPSGIPRERTNFASKAKFQQRHKTLAATSLRMYALRRAHVENHGCQKQ